MKMILLLISTILLLVGCNGQNGAVKEPSTDDTETTISLSENAEVLDINMLFEQGILYLESESTYNSEGNYLGSDQYFVIFDPVTKEKKVSGLLEGHNRNPQLVRMDGEDRIFVQRSEGTQLAADLGYYSLPKMAYTPLNVPNPGTTWQHGVSDYFVDNNMVYYLQGCRGIFCNIRQVDLGSGEDTILAEDIEVENMYAVNLGEILSDNGGLYLIDGYGHAGSGYVSVHTFSLEDASVEQVEYETILTFCKDELYDESDKDWLREEYGFTGKECTEEQLELNRRYDVVLENYFQEHPKECDDYQIEYSNEQKKHLLVLEGETIALGDWVQLVACN